jgi:recombination protein RecA
MESKITTDDLVSRLRKKHSEGRVATLASKERAGAIKYWIKTGNSLLDAAICIDWESMEGRGIPGGRITELIGRSSTGKSALCFSMMAQCQQQGGIAVLLDTEAAADFQFAELLGVDTDKLIVAQPTTVEDVYEMTLDIGKEIRSVEPNAPVLFCADSCTTTTNEELGKEMHKASKIGENARLQRRGLRSLMSWLAENSITFVGVNHVCITGFSRYGHPIIGSTGGGAWEYYPSLRIVLGDLQKVRVSNNKDSAVKAVEVVASIIKNRMSPPEQEAKLVLDFKNGFDNLDALLQFGQVNGMFGTSAASSGWFEFNGKKYRKNQLKDEFQQNEQAMEELVKKCVSVMANRESLGIEVDPTTVVPE